MPPIHNKLFYATFILPLFTKISFFKENTMDAKDKILGTADDKGEIILYQADGGTVRKRQACHRKA